MYKINYDGNKNRVYGVLEGFMKIEEIREYNEALKNAIKSAKPGFTALFDNRKLKALSDECNEVLKSGKELATSKGLTKSAIVVSSAILEMQAKRIFKDIGQGSDEKFFSSMEEAEAFLNN